MNHSFSSSSAYSSSSSSSFPSPSSSDFVTSSSSRSDLPRARASCAIPRIVAAASVAPDGEIVCPLCQRHRPAASFALAGQVVELEGPNGQIIRARSRMKRAAKPQVVKVVFKDDSEANEGQLQPIASRILMKILYAARVCRFDLFVPSEC